MTKWTLPKLATIKNKTQIKENKKFTGLVLLDRTLTLTAYNFDTIKEKIIYRKLKRNNKIETRDFTWEDKTQRSILYSYLSYIFIIYKTLLFIGEL